MPLAMDKSKSKTGLQYLRNYIALLTDVQWDISDLSFVKNKDYQY